LDAGHKAIYGNWGKSCTGKQVYTLPHRSEWLGKFEEAGVRRAIGPDAAKGPHGVMRRSFTCAEQVSGLKKARLCRVAPRENYACSMGFASSLRLGVRPNLLNTSCYTFRDFMADIFRNFRQVVACPDP